MTGVSEIGVSGVSPETGVSEVSGVVSSMDVLSLMFPSLKRTVPDGKGRLVRSFFIFDVSATLARALVNLRTA